MLRCRAVSRDWHRVWAHARCADDMALLLQVLMLHSQRSNVPAALTAEADSIQVPRVLVPGMPNDAPYGFGLFVDRWHGAQRAWHPGAMSGYSTLFEYLPAQRVGIVVLANRDGIRLDRIAEAALETLIVLPGEADAVAESAMNANESLPS